jgi:ABC-type polysaccharide/polyol phosphate transport system ATPase subunit
MRTSDFVIQVESVSKCYVRRPRTLLDSLSQFMFRHRSGRGSSVPAENSEFWALREVSFAVERGETLGIIGENGAGKSTILKLIAGITAPTTGRINADGRVATLIELGAGFNPELTGRENVYLNGAVLGLKRREIENSFESIASFSGLGHFLDMPVKYYSSGMYARLGFSIAAHVKADIILTDEILAVGDAAFQHQCLKKIQELKASSTIIFVSHDLSTINKICTRVLWLKGGRLQLTGAPEKVIDAYLQSVQQDREESLRAGRSLWEPGTDAKRWGSGEIEIVEVITCDGQGQARSVFKTFDDLIIRIHYRVNGLIRDPGFGVKICSPDDVFVHGTNTFIQESKITVPHGTGTIHVRYPRLPLLAGTYWLTVGVTSGNDWAAPYDLRERVNKFEVLTTRPDGGVISLNHSWSDDVQI